MSKTVLLTTYHKALSYGGCLQAYATYRLISDLGYTVKIIDFENAYEARKKNSLTLVKNGTAKEIAAGLAKDVLFHGAQYRNRAFGRFSECLTLTERRYESVSSMGDLQADVLVVGSDQVWNPEITGGVEPAFFLDFGKADKRVSLSSSMGSHIPTQAELSEMVQYLKRFTAISVRERFAKNHIDSITGKDVRVTLDPTLLIVPDEWRRFSAKPTCHECHPYAIVFMVAHPVARYEQYLKLVSEATGLKLLQIRLNSHKPAYIDATIPATPQEFVWLIDHASLVLTDSFHGVAFSCNLQVPFLYLPNEVNSVRAEELLSLCELEGVDLRDVKPSAAIPCIDYSPVSSVIERRRAEDRAWLKEALG